MSTLPTPAPDFDETGDILATVEATFDGPAYAPTQARRRTGHQPAPERPARGGARKAAPTRSRRRLQVVPPPMAAPYAPQPGRSGSRETSAARAGTPVAIQAPPATQGPRRVVSAPNQRGRIVAGSATLTVGVVAVVVLTFLAMTTVFPWLAVFDDHDDAGLTSVSRPDAEVRTVADPGPSPAEKVVDTVMSTSLPAFDDATGWDEAKPTTSISSPSLGFGCDPKDGLSPAAASTRGWVTADGSTSVTISARAYSAGAGAIALDGLTAASSACDPAWVAYPSVTLGVEATQIESRTVAALVWRRGDVLMTAQVTAAHAAGNPGAYADALHRLDDALDAALTNVCVDQGAGAESATRSPYVNRRAYAGLHVAEEVPRPEPTRRTAEQRIRRDPTAASNVEVVPTPAPVKTLPDVGTLPTAPYPLPTTGPVALPDVVTAPTVPLAPREPDATVQVQRAVADTVGPGCGWDFTGQAVPVFDSTAATADYDQAVDAAVKRLTRAWVSWQDAKVAYYEAYARYLAAVKRYKAYAVEVAAVRAAWGIIADARADFYTDHANWQAAVDARDAWRDERAQARADFTAARQACRAQAPEPGVPTATPTPDPSGAPSSTPTSTPTPTPTGPGQPDTSDTSGLVCPPVRPEILDETPPTVPTEPTPRPEAQLPR